VLLPTVRDTGKYKIVMFSHYLPLAFRPEAVHSTGVGTPFLHCLSRERKNQARGCFAGN